MKFWKEFMPYVVIFMVVVLIRTFIVTPVRVVGSSMYPTLQNGEVLFLNKIKYRFNPIQRFDIVVLKKDDDLIKRIVGLPGEHVKYVSGKLYINNELVDDFKASITNNFDLISLGVGVIPDDYYFVVGDNRNDSLDSRIIGLIKRNEIKGTARLRIWPLNKVGIVKY